MASPESARVVQHQLSMAKSEIAALRKQEEPGHLGSALLSLYTAVEHLSKIVLDGDKPIHKREGVRVD